MDIQIDMKLLQESLKLLGLYTGEITGEMDENTKDVIKKIQKIIGMEPTGEINMETLEYIKDKLGVISVKAADLQEYIQDVIDDMSLYYEDFDDDEEI